MTKRQLATLLATLTSILATATAENSSDYRLPKIVTPYQYDISLTIDPEADGCNGTVIIKFANNNVTANITHFVMNADPQFVTISSVIVNGKIDCTFVENANKTLVYIDCPQGFSSDSSYATVVFSSKYTDNSAGIYKQSYVENGITNWFVASNFEPQEARMAIPCFDEPAFKAVFNLVVTIPTGYKVLSNAAVDHVKTDVATETYYFESTPKMSTYLLAISVSKFESVSGANDDYKIFARPEASPYTSHAVYYGQLCLNTMSNWLGIPYESLGISKFYQIAEPHRGGAMENWALITYGEYSILDTGENSTSTAQKQSIFTNMCHEISHQWFGDYVTNIWWSELWLNEGFATYFQWFMSDTIDPSFELSQLYVVWLLQPVLEDDSVPTSLPIVSNEDDIYTLANVNRKFDSISYEKGSAMLAFIEYFVGAANFRQGLVNYLNTWNLSNPNTDSFLSIMGTTANISYFYTYMHDWLHEPGYPVVNVSLSDSGTKIRFTQQRYFGPGITANSNTQWYVPISYTFASDSDFSVDNINTWLEPNKTLEIDYTDQNGWIVVNLQERGIYRVNYDDVLWKKIATALKQNVSQIHVTNRAQIIDDVFSLGKTDYVDLSVALDMVSFLKNDSSYHPWYVGVRHLTSLLGVGDEKDDDDLKSLILSLVQDHVLIPDDSANASVYNPIRITYQNLMLKTACDVGHPGCIAYAEEQFAKFKNGLSLDPDFKSVIICEALKNSKTPREDYDFVHKLYMDTDSEVEKSMLESGLACLSDADVVREYLTDIIINNSKTDNSKTQKIITNLYSNNPNSINAILDFVVNKNSDIVEHFKGTSQLSALLTGLGSKLKTDDQIQKLEQLKRTTAAQDLADTIETALNKAHSNKNWLESHKSSLKAALKATSLAVSTMNT